MATPQYFAGPANNTGGYPYSYGAQGSEKFPNPFFDIASTFMPTELNTLFEMSEYIYTTFGTWRMASRRVIAYFLTEIILDGGSDDEREKLKDFLMDDLHIMQELAAIGHDKMVYGNSIFSVILPFDRFLRTADGIEVPINRIDYRFDPNDCSFHGPHPSTGEIVKFEVIDRRSTDKKRTRIKRWNPKEIVMRVHPVTGRQEHLWRVNSRFCRLVKEGHKFYVEDTDMEILKCICNYTGSGDPLFQFKPDSVMHLSETTLAGLPIAGWAIPPIIANFKLAYYIQVLRRFDEAIAQDFIVPFRILSPDYGPGGSETSDPLRQNSMGVMRSMLQTMVQEHRKDPTLVQIAPYKIAYQMVGGEGQQLTPKDQLAMAFDELLNALGYPAELYKGTLSIQAFPTALRLFERTWTDLVEGNNSALKWITKKITQHFSMGTDFSAKLRSVTLADDLERKALSLQAAAGMDISKNTAYLPFGIDYLDEQKRIVEEQAEVMRLQQEAQQQQQSNAVADDSGNTGPGGPVGASPGDVYAQAQALAQQLLFQTPETMRRGELIKIKQSNPTLHALVLQQMDEIRRSMNSQGGAMMMEQQKQMAQGGQGMVAQAAAPLSIDPLFVQALVCDQLYGYNRYDMLKIAGQMRQNTASDPARIALHYLYRVQRGWPVTMKYKG